MVKDLPEEDYENRATMSANEFSKLVFEISQQLKVRDVEALKYMYGVFEENISNLRVLTVLESRGVFSNSNIDGLRTLLRNIQRCDLLEMLRETEQDRRLKLCYFQAMSLEEKLKAIKDELISFAGKQECSPTERSFCSKITDRVEMVRKEMKEFLVQPLGEVITVGKTHSISSELTSTIARRIPSLGGTFPLSGSILLHHQIINSCNFLHQVHSLRTKES